MLSGIDCLLFTTDSPKLHDGGINEIKVFLA